MRDLTDFRLSYTAIDTFDKDRNEFYLRYMADQRPPRTAQTRPMLIGSGFDALVKLSLDGVDRFDQMVRTKSEADREWVRENAEYIFQRYEQAGLVDRLRMQGEDIQLELESKGEVEGVPMVGYPDGLLDRRKILDWKVNGYCGNRTTSPNPGYVVCFDLWSDEEGKHSRSHNKTHEWAGQPFEVFSATWAAQLTLYERLQGITDAEYIIHQLVAKPRPDDKPLLRCAVFEGRPSEKFQEEFLAKMHACWQAVQNETVVSSEQAKKLDKRSAALRKHGQGMINNLLRKQKFTRRS